MNDAVGCDGAVAQAVVVFERAAVHVGAGSGQYCGGRVRAGEADRLMPGFEEFADNRRSDISGRAGDKHTHSEVRFSGWWSV